MSAAAAPAVPAPADARPVIVQDVGHHLLEGSRCRRCRHPMARRQPRCARCGSPTDVARFGPQGTIWAVTVLHVAARPDDVLPVTLAYVDLDDGPRLLARITSGAGAAAVGDRLALIAVTAAGDPAAQVAG